jgi:hypothetical protein
MRMPFGKCAGQSVELVVLKHPDYVLCKIRQPDPDIQMRRVIDEAKWLIDVFDRKPLAQKKCTTRGCANNATRYSIDNTITSGYLWCDSCDPTSWGLSENAFSIIRQYNDIIVYIEFY